MSWVTIILRLLHVVGGVLWVGFAVFGTFFLLPSIAESGEEGSKVMTVLQRRGLFTAFPIFALVTVLSGFWLYAHASSVAPGFSSSGMGMTLGFGGICALLALILGMSIVTPSIKRATAAAQQAAQATANERQALLGLATKHRTRAASAIRIATLLLIIAACAMAVGRYV